MLPSVIGVTVNLLIDEFLEETPKLKECVDYYMPCKEFGEWLLKKLGKETVKKRDKYLKQWNKLKASGMDHKKSIVFGTLEFIEEELLGGDASKYV